MIEDQHLQVLLDADGLIGPDGHPIQFESNVTQTENRKQATVVFDCGFTLPQVTRSVLSPSPHHVHGFAFSNRTG